MSPDWVNAVNAYSTLTIAVFTVFLFLGVLVQLRTGRDNERAWLTVLPGIWSPELYPKIKPEARPDGDYRPAIHLFPAIMRNIGRTPARLTETGFRYVLLTSLADLPIKPTYKNISRENGHLLFSDEEQWAHIRLTDGSDEGLLSEEQVMGIRNGSIFLYAYGFVAYRDAYDRRHRTRFGFVYNFPKGLSGNIEKPGFKRAGPKSYNEAT
jgi:hypothetical protein